VAEQELGDEGQAEGRDPAEDGVGHGAAEARGQAHEHALRQRALHAENADRAHRRRDDEAGDEAFDE
jgi:hypothetical protein